MKNHLTILIFFLTLICSQHIGAQEGSGINNDSLTFYLENNDFIAYFDRITELSKSAVAQSDFNRLIPLSNLLQQDFDTLSIAQRKALRKAAMLMGHKIWNKIGNYNEALSIYLIAHENVPNKKTLDSLAWYIENDISTYYTMKGDYEKAEYFSIMLENSLKYYRMTKFLSRYYTNLGRKLTSEFKVEEAIKVFKVGLHLADSIQYNSGLFANGINLAEVYNDYPNLGNSESYLLISAEYLPTLREDSKYLEKEAAFKLESARYLSNLGKYDESVPLFRDAIHTLSQFYSHTNRREFAKFYTPLARVYAQLDSIPEAELTIHRALVSLIPEFKRENDLPLISQLYPENSFIDLFVLKGEIYEKQFIISGDKVYLEKSLASVELALRVNDLIRESVIADPSKLVTIHSNKDLIQKGITILYQLYSLDNNLVYQDKARAFFDRSKSLLYGEKTRRNNLVSILSNEDKEKWAALQKEIKVLHDEKFSAQADINAINGQILHCQELIDGIFGTYDHIPLTIQKPGFYIEYFMSDEGIYAFAELNDHKIFIQLGQQKDFQALADRLREFILQKGRSMDETILNEMYAFLIKPLHVQLPPDVVIIPDGSIGYVPFEMLKDNQGKYLLESTTISYLFEYLTYDQEGSEERKTLDIFCLAPQYKMKEVRKDEVMRGSVYHLPYAKMEVDSIHALYGETALVSQSGDKTEWENNISNSRVFHYAGHAIIRSDVAFLVLNDSDDEKQQLTGKEIGLMHHSLDMVVLSACETGLGKLEHGEGIRSLGRSFMESGAKATVISLWNVNDKSTALIMTAFYKNLRAGMEKDAALRQSKLDYIKNISARYVHPYFWAAFIPAGNMNVLINN